MKKFISILVAVVVSVASVFAFEAKADDNWEVNQYITKEGVSDEEAVAKYVETFENMVFNKGYGVASRVEAINFDDYETFEEAIEAVFGEDISSLNLTMYKHRNTLFLSYDDPSTLKRTDILAEVGVTINGLMYIVIIFPLEA